MAQTLVPYAADLVPGLVHLNEGHTETVKGGMKGIDGTIAYRTEAGAAEITVVIVESGGVVVAEVEVGSGTGTTSVGGETDSYSFVTSLSKVPWGHVCIQVVIFSRAARSCLATMLYMYATI